MSFNSETTASLAELGNETNKQKKNPQWNTKKFKAYFTAKQVLSRNDWKEEQIKTNPVSQDRSLLQGAFFRGGVGGGTTAVTCIKDQSSWSRGCTRAAFYVPVRTRSQRLRREGDLYHSFYPFRKGLQAAVPIYQTASHLKSNFPRRHHEITDIFSPSPPPCQSP